tara:strand:- start:2402 stop:2806 length:405 start_codon:yes stop_codon:yes gene_type:complete
MFPWERLVTLHRNPPDDKITRNQKIQSKYEKFMNNIKENNINLNDYIYNKFLNGLNVNFIENTFPYDIEDNCYHYVIWFDNEYFKKVTNSINENKIINNIVRSKFKDNQYIYFENLSNNKSVAKIKHFHVFIKN